jgi:glycosyltransferase involved in cell wall biosynthesis
MRLLGNGIDLDRFDPTRFDVGERADIRRELGAEGEQVVVATVGRLVVEKGILEVLDAAHRLHEQGRGLQWAVIGPTDPAKADAVPPATLERAGREHVTLLGERDDVDRLYAGIDIFVLASHREGFPRAAMEAAAMGIPVVATAIRGCRQVVDHGRTGLLVPPHDAAALADAVAELAADRDRRLEMGQAAREKARREFDQQRVIAVTLGLYAEMIDRG